MSGAVAAKRVAAVLAAAAVASPLVVEFEGWVLRGYRDPVGIVTACAGDTNNVTLGKAYTEDECQRRLALVLVDHGLDIAPCINAQLPVEIHAAALSFAYNVGASKACASTMFRKLNARDFRGACAEFSRWTYAGGRQLPGLVRRRAAERALCESGLNP